MLVVGVGAVGGTAAGVLLRGGHDVTLVDAWYENVEAIRRHGLHVTVDGVREALPARAIYPDELTGRASVVFLACKSYDTEPLVRVVVPYLAEDGVIVSLQNGINEDRIAALAGAHRTVGCVVHFGAGMMEPGHAVRYSPSAWRSFTVGALDGRDVSGVAALLGGARVTDEIRGALWGKLALNCMINALSAATGLPTPRLWPAPGAIPVMAALAAEAAAVARASGHEMQPIHLPASGGQLPASLLLAGGGHELMEAEAVARAAATGSDARTSMLQDILKRRRTEIDYINGHVVREGARLGVPTPVNEALTALLRAVAAGDEPQDPAHIARLAPA